MLAIDRTDHRPAALERVRELANELARSNPNAKELIRELFLAFKSVYEEVRHPIEVESMENAYAALAMVREAMDEVAPGACPRRKASRSATAPSPSTRPRLSRTRSASFSPRRIAGRSRRCRIGASSGQEGA
jgi:hypothetical protein